MVFSTLEVRQSLSKCRLQWARAMENPSQVEFHYSRTLLPMATLAEFSFWYVRQAHLKRRKGTSRLQSAAVRQAEGDCHRNDHSQSA